LLWGIYEFATLPEPPPPSRMFGASHGPEPLRSSIIWLRHMAGSRRG